MKKNLPILGFLSFLLKDGSLKPPFPLVFKLPDASGALRSISPLPLPDKSRSAEPFIPASSEPKTKEINLHCYVNVNSDVYATPNRLFKFDSPLRSSSKILALKFQHTSSSRVKTIQSAGLYTMA